MFSNWTFPTELGNSDKRSYSESKKSQTGDIATFFPKSAAFDHQEQIPQNCNTEKNDEGPKYGQAWLTL